MQPSAKDNGNHWKIGLALLFGTFLVGMAATMVTAARRVGAVTDVDYYQNGLHYGRTASGSVNPGLRWTISASLAGGELQVRVKDESGAPVAGGKLRFEPKRVEAGVKPSLALAESAPGFFRAPRPASPRGDLHGTLRFTLGEATASRKLVLFN